MHVRVLSARARARARAPGPLVSVGGLRPFRKNKVKFHPFGGSRFRFKHFLCAFFSDFACFYWVVLIALSLQSVSPLSFRPPIRWFSAIKFRQIYMKNMSFPLLILIELKLQSVPPQSFGSPIRGIWAIDFIQIYKKNMSFPLLILIELNLQSVSPPSFGSPIRRF